MIAAGDVWLITIQTRRAQSGNLLQIVRKAGLRSQAMTPLVDGDPLRRFAE
jgi:hypothetical protein